MREEINEHHFKITYEDILGNRKYIREEIYNPLGLAWVNLFFEDNSPKIFKNYLRN